MTPQVHNPAAANQATAAQGAPGVGYKNVCVGIIASIATGATAQTPIHVYLRDGTTGAGTIIASFVLSAPANSCAWIEMSDLSIHGTENTAMTLEFEGAGVAASVESITLLSVVQKT